MKSGRLLLISILVIAILTTSSLAAIRTVSYNSEIDLAQIPWNKNHVLPYFDPDLGKLLRIDFVTTLNGSEDVCVQNYHTSQPAQAYVTDNASLQVTMLNGLDIVPLRVDMRSPETGMFTLDPYTGQLCGNTSDSETDVDNGSTQGGIFYTNAADLAPYIGTGTFNLPGSTIAEILVKYFGGSVLATLNTYGWSNATIKYTYDDARCLSGYKIDGCTGLPLSGWNVTVKNSTNYEWETTTDSNGFWQICQLENDTYTVCEVPQAGWTQTDPIGCYTKVLAGINITNLNFTNQKMYCISGYKLDNCTGAPLQGWNITLKNATKTVWQLTGANGKYEFCNLKPGDYTLTEEARSGYIAVEVVSNPVRLNCSNVTYRNFTNQKLLCIEGRKINNCTKAGLAGWNVTLTNGSYSANTTTNITGYYQFCGLMPDRYKVSEILKPGWKNVTTLDQTAELGCLNNKTNVDFYNDPLLCLSGTKFNNCTKLGLDGWTVIVKDSKGTEVGRNVTVGGGKWQVCGLLPGAYTVSELLKPNWKNVTALNQNVTLSCTNLTGVDFYNDPLLCLSGTKFNNCTKLGLDGWTVIVKDSKGTEVGRNVTVGGGKWQVCGLLPGAYTVSELLKPNWKNVTALNQNVTLGCTNLTGIDFYNDPLLCISGFKFNNCTRAGLDGWTVIIRDSKGTEVGRNVTVGGGKWSVCNLLPGTYTVTEELKPLWKNVTALTQTVVLGCDNRTGIDFYNDPLLCISGTKFNNCTKLGLDGWTVIVKNSTGVEVGRNVTVGGGKWSVCNLLPGTYTVTEELKANWKNVTALTQTVVLGCTNRTGIDFYNDPLLCISGTKFNNCNESGLRRLDHNSQELDRRRGGQECDSRRRQVECLQPASRNLHSNRRAESQLEERYRSHPDCGPGLR